MGHLSLVKSDTLTITINRFDKNKKNEEAKTLPGEVTPDMVDKNGRIRTENFEKPQIAAKNDGYNQQADSAVTVPLGGNNAEFDYNFNFLKKNLPLDYSETYNNASALLKNLEENYNDKNDVLAVIKEWIKRHGGNNIENGENNEGTNPGNDIELPGAEEPNDIDPGVTIKPPKVGSEHNDPGYNIELPKDSENIDPGFKIKPSEIGEFPRTEAVKGNKRTYQKAPEKRAKNGLNLADAYKIMDYIQQRHKVTDKNGSYYDMRNLSPAEEQLYSMAVRAVNELNPRSMVYDTSNLDTSKADELIKKFEEENS